VVRARDRAVVEWGAERARVATWRGDPHLAYLAPVPEGPPPSADFLRRCIERLTNQGFDSVVTPALSPAEQRPFLAAGFEPHERLHLLAHDLLELPPRRRGATRRARRRDRRRVLAVDGAAFSPFWRLDGSGLSEALQAVPTTRFRVSPGRGGPLLGYAISGRAGRQGYLQRLAVDPAHQREGRGRALVADALHWLHRRGVARAVVNTQLGNEAALALYGELGFRLQPSGLAVLRRGLR
jgi:ribosomal protein S18 acetylase RimI-like enzyme